MKPPKVVQKIAEYGAESITHEDLIEAVVMTGAEILAMSTILKTHNIALKAVAEHMRMVDRILMRLDEDVMWICQSPWCGAPHTIKRFMWEYAKSQGIYCPTCKYAQHPLNMLQFDPEPKP